MNNLVDLGETLTPEAIKRLKPKQTLSFKQPDGSMHTYKIIRINKRKKSVWAERMEFMTEEQIDKLSDKDKERIFGDG